jgi:hypothetical protein
MKTWTLTDAKTRIVEIFRSCLQEPQIIYDLDKPIGVIVDVRLFNELMNLHTRQHRPTIAELLDELTEIHKFEKVEIEAPTRQDRPNAMIEMVDEISQ